MVTRDRLEGALVTTSSILIYFMSYLVAVDTALLVPPAVSYPAGHDVQSQLQRLTNISIESLVLIGFNIVFHISLEGWVMLLVNIGNIGEI